MLHLQMNLGLIKEAGKIWHNCLTGDRQNECPPHLPCSICPLVSPAQHSLLSCTEPLHLLERFPHIFERLSSLFLSLFRFGIKCLSSEQPSLPSQVKTVPTPALPTMPVNLIFLGGTCQYRQPIMLVLVSTACHLDDTVLSFCALSPDRAKNSI